MKNHSKGAAMVKMLSSVAGILLAVHAIPARADDGFTGVFDFNLWTFVSGGTGAAHSADSSTISLNGSQNLDNIPTRTTFTTNVAGSYLLSFDWSYTTIDPGGPVYDPAGYVAGGGDLALSTSDGGSPQTGSVTNALFEGGTFGFFVDADNFSDPENDGFGSITITNFHFSLYTPVISTWTGAESGNWNAAGNWDPNTSVPNDPTAQVEFGASSQTDVTIDTDVQLGLLRFTAPADAYTLTIPDAPGSSLSFYGAGIDNLSSQTQTIVNHRQIDFFNNSSAGNAVITSTGPNASISFGDNSSAGTATITADDGADAFFAGNSTAANASVVLSDGTLDISALSSFTFSLGSLAGSGDVFLGSRFLLVGALDTDTEISALIQDGGIGSGTGGVVSKFGTGTLTLSASNTFTGSLFISAGAVNVATLPVATEASPIGEGSLQFYGGALKYTGPSVTTTHTFSGNTGGGAIEITQPGTTLTLNSGFNGANTGLPADAMIKKGPGTLVLTGSSDDSGLDFIVNDGTLVLDKASEDFVHSVKALTVNNGATAVIAGSGGRQIGDNETLTINTGGTLDFNGRDETVGTLSGSGSVTNNASATTSTMTLGYSDGSGTFGGAISDGAGTMAVIKAGTGTEVLTGTNTYTGGTTISGGTLQIGNGGTTGSIAGNIYSNGKTLVFDRSDTVTFSGTLDGGGYVVHQGAGTLILTGNNPYGFATTINSGILQIGNGGATGSIDGSFTNNGSLVVNRTGTLEITGNISGTGSLTKSGTGALTLSGTSTYSGGTTVSAGTLAGTTASLKGAITNNSNVTFGQDFNGTYSGVMGGSGTLTKSGTGNVALTGATTYSGGTTISGGTLQVNADSKFSSGTLTLDGGGVRYGAAFDDLRAYTPGPGGATLDTNGFNVTYAHPFASDGYFSKDGAGTLTLGGGSYSLTSLGVFKGDLILPAGTTLTTSSYVEISNFDFPVIASTSLTITGSGSHWTANGAALDFSIGYEGKGTFTISNGASVDITDPSSIVTIAGDGGTDATANVTGAGSLWTVPGLLKVGVFGAGALNVSSGGVINSGSAIMADGDGGGGTSTASITGAGSQWNVADDMFWIGYSGSASMTVSSGGALNSGTSTAAVLAVSNDAAPSTLSITTGGTVTVGNGSGILKVAVDNGFGAVGTVNIGTGGTAGTLNAASVDLGTDIGWGPGTATLAFNHTDNIAFAIPISGPGKVNKTGAGTLTLNGVNTYTGATSISGGTVVIGNNSAFGTGTVSLAGATLSADATARSIGNNVTLAGNATIGGASNLTITGNFTNSGGDRTLTLDNTGLTTLGNVRLSNTAATGRTLTLAGGGDLAITGVISNASGTGTTAGNLVKTGSGSLTLGSANTYTGATTLSNGTVTAGKIVVSSGTSSLGNATSVVTLGGASTSATLSYTGNTATYTRGLAIGAGGGTFSVATSGQTVTMNTAGITAGGLFTVGGDGNTTISSAISGTGGLTKTGNGLLVLGSANTYASGGGTTRIAGGTLRLNIAGALPSTSSVQLDGGVLEIGTGAPTAFTLGTGAGQLQWTSAGGLAAFGAARSVTLNSGAGLTWGSGGFVPNGSSLLLATTTSNNTLTLTNAIDLGGTTRTVSVAQAAGPVSAPYATLSGALTGSAPLNVTGGGWLGLSGSNSGFSGGVTLINGTLSVGSDTALGTGTFTFGDGNFAGALMADGSARTIGNNIVLTTGALAAYQLGGTLALTLNGSISGDASTVISQTGSNTLTLNGASTLAGTFQLNNGTVVIGNDAAFGTGLVQFQSTIQGDGTSRTIANTAEFLPFTIAGSSNLTFNGDFTNTYIANPTVTISNTGTTTFNGAIKLSDISTNRIVTFSTGAGANVSITGPITNGNLSTASGITKSGAGTLTISGTNTYGGATTISGGILSVSSLANGGSNSNIGKSANTAAGLVLNGGTLKYTGPAQSTDRLFTLGTGATAGTIDASGTAALNFTATGSMGTTGTGTRTLTLTGTNTDANTLAAIIPNQGANATSLAKTGAGTWVLSGVNTYTGTTTVSAGTLRATTSASALGAGTLTLSGGTLELANNTGLAFNRNTTVSGAATIKSDRLAAGAGVTHTLGTLGISGQTLTIAAGTNATSGTAGITFGTTTLSTSNGSTFDVGANAGLTLGAVGGAFTFVKQGAGLLTLNTTSTRTTTAGSTTLTAGTLKLGVASALNTNAATALALNGGTLQLAPTSDAATTFNGAATTIGGSVTITPDRGTTAGAGVTHTLGTLSIGTQTLTVAHGSNFSTNNTGSLTFGATTLTGNPAFTLNNVNGSGVGILTLGALNDGGAARTLTKDGSGALTLATAATSLVNGTAVNLTAGTLNLNQATALGSLANITLSSGATLALGASPTLGALNGSGGTVTLGANVLTVGNATNNLSSSFGGSIGGSGSLVKNGAGTFTLTSSNSYTGATTISAGTLKVNGSLASGSAVTVAGGTLAGSGTLAGTVAINNGGTISPGNSPGTMNTGAETWTGGGSYVWEINKANGTKGADPGWDWLNITGTLNITATSGSKFTISINSLTLADVSGLATGFVRGTPYSFPIATASGGITNFNASKFLINTSAFFNDPANEGSFAISQVGNDILLTYTAIPEPSTWAAAAFLFILALAKRRRA